MSSDQSSGDEGACGASVDQVLDLRFGVLEGEGRRGGAGCDWVGQHADEFLRPSARMRASEVTCVTGCHVCFVGQPRYAFFA